MSGPPVVQCPECMQVVQVDMSTNTWRYVAHDFEGEFERCPLSNEILLNVEVQV